LIQPTHSCNIDSIEASSLPKLPDFSKSIEKVKCATAVDIVLKIIPDVKIGISGFSCAK